MFKRFDPSDLPEPPPDALQGPIEAEIDEPKWLVYQKAIAELEKKYGDGCRVLHDHKVMGRRSKEERQVDVWLEVEVGYDHGVTIAIECKRLADPVGIKDVDAFYGFLDDVGANKGIIFSSSGYTKGAQARADGATIELRVQSIDDLDDFDWPEYIEDQCQVSFNDCMGSVSWDMQDGETEAGNCWSCGTFHVKCGLCGSIRRRSRSRQWIFARQPRRGNLRVPER